MRRGMATVRPPATEPEEMAIEPAAVVAAEPAVVATEPVKDSRPKWQRDGMTRYTMNLDRDGYRVFDELMIAARRQLGGRVDKAEIIRAFLLLAADDASLREQVIREIHRARSS